MRIMAMTTYHVTASRNGYLVYSAQHRAPTAAEAIQAARDYWISGQSRGLSVRAVEVAA